MTVTQQQRFDKRVLKVVGSVLFGAVLTGVVAFAQDHQGSHRLLPFPAGGPADIRSQLSYLSELQRLTSGNDVSPGRLDMPPGVEELFRDADPDQLPLLRELIEHAMRQNETGAGAETEAPLFDADAGLSPPQLPPSQLPPQSFPQTSPQIVPQLSPQISPQLRQAWKDPRVRQQAQRLLEQLRNDRSTGARRNGERMIGASPDERTRQLAPPRTSGQRAEFDSRPDPRNTDPRNSGERDNSLRGSAQRQSTPLPSWLRDVMAPEDARQATSQRTSTEDSSNGAQQRSSAGTGSAGEAAEARGGSIPDRRQQEDQQRASLSAGQPADLQRLVQELAQSAQAMDTQATNAQATNAQATTGDAFTRAASSNSAAIEASAEATTTGEVASRGPREFLDPLGHEELKLAFQEIVKEAVADGARSGDPVAMPEDVRKSVMQMLNGMHGDLVDILKEVMLRNGGDQQADAGNDGGSTSESAARNSRASARSKPVARSPLDWFDRLTKAPAGTPASSLADLSGTDGLSAPSVMAALLILAAVCLAVHSLQKRFLARSAQAERAMRELRLMQINSGEDVVRAFHQLVAIMKQPAEVWWPHRRAAQALTLAAPSSAVAAEILADLYEQIRYLPSGATLTAEQLDEARAAIQRCASC